MQEGYVKMGTLMVEWDHRGVVRVTRQDNGQVMQLSDTELALVLGALEFRGRVAVASPTEFGHDQTAK